MMRKQVNIQQRTPEWHAWRGDRIGASDAPVLLRVSPFKTELQLYKEKINKGAIAVNDSMRAGAYYEPEALELANKQLGACYAPSCFDHPLRSYMFASLDGWHESNGVLELKMANNDDHDLAKAGIVPEKYVPQLQDQMAVTLTKHAMYGSYIVRDNKVADIAFVMLHRDDEMVDRIEVAAECFYERIQAFDMPEPVEEDYVVFDDSEAKDLEFYFLEADELANKYKASRDKFRLDILAHVGRRNAIVGNRLRVTEKEVPGRVDYDLVPELKGINLDPYRGAKTIQYEIRKIKSRV